MDFLFNINNKSTLKLLKESIMNKNISDKEYINIIEQLSERTENYEEREIIKTYIIKKMNLTPDHWIKIYKTLKLICYLVKGGSLSFIQDLKYEIDRFEQLSECKYFTNGVENIKEKAKYLWNVLSDDNMIKKEREIYKQDREKELKAEQLTEGGLLNSIGRFTFDQIQCNKNKYDLTQKQNTESSNLSSESSDESLEKNVIQKKAESKDIKNNNSITRQTQNKTNSNVDLLLFDNKSLSYVNNLTETFDLLSFDNLNKTEFNSIQANNIFFDLPNLQENMFNKANLSDNNFQNFTYNNCSFNQYQNKNENKNNQGNNNVFDLS